MGGTIQSCAGSVAGGAANLALTENKDFIASLLKSTILANAFANLVDAAQKSVEAEAKAQGKIGKVEHVDLLSCLGFFTKRVNAELEAVGKKEQTLDQATDNLLKILFPNKADDLHIADGSSTGL